MRIVVASVKRYKRVRNVVIEPAADAAWILLAGKNKQGKSSVLDAITRCLRGKKAQAAKPVREGEVDAEIRVVLDSGITVETVILPDGTSHLVVSNADGAAIKAPQAYLDKLIGSCFIDPLEFLRISDAKQREMLLELIDRDGSIAALDKRHASLFDTRTDVGRELKRAEGELSRMPEVAIPVAINVAELSAERARLADIQRQGDALGAVAREKATALRAATDREFKVGQEISELDRQVEDLQRRLVQQHEQLGSARQAVSIARLSEQSAVEAVAQYGRRWADAQPLRTKLDDDLARADAHNRTVVEAETITKRRADASATVAELQTRRDAQTEKLDKIGAQKVAALKAANLPVDGLGFDDTGLTLDGVPFAQASAAQRFMAALAIAAAASPGLDDVFLRDGAILDDDSLAAIAAHAESTGKRYWVEVIKHDDATITIHDGRVVGSGDE